MMESKDIVLLELFSGIGGFAKGLTDAGFNITEHYFSEIDKHAIANYKYNFPNAKFIGAVQDVRGLKIKPTIITFGWPCQDNSLAGKRKGQSKGTRSGLLFEAGRIISELKPRYFIAENVKGLYSVNEGIDFYKAIEFLTYLNSDSPQYTVEMQLLNTAWLLPQNRERTYFIGHNGTTRIKRVFPVGENLSESFGKLRSKDIPNGQIEGQDKPYKNIARTITSTQREDSRTINLVALRSFPRNGSKDFDGERFQNLEINKSGNTNTITGVQKDNLIMIEGRINSSQDGIVHNVNGISQTLSAGHGNVPKILDVGHKNEGVRIYDTESPTLQARDYKEPKLVMQPDLKIRKLTETECERLQGYPDGWTQYGIYEEQVWINKKIKTFELVVGTKKIPKSQRYKLIGNAVTRDVVEMIGKKLLKNTIKV